MIITLDGPAGVGKSTLALDLAKYFDIACLDTGAMYRAIGRLLGNEVRNMSDEEIGEKLNLCHFDFNKTDERHVLYLNNEIIGEEIRTEEVGKLASVVASKPIIRKKLQGFQRKIGEQSSLVTEGRDMGSVVFPSADFKFFLDANPKVRAKRRYDQLIKKNISVDLEQIYHEIVERDKIDRERSTDPLKPAHDAKIIDTSDLTEKEVFKVIIDLIEKSSF